MLLSLSGGADGEPMTVELLQHLYSKGHKDMPASFHRNCEHGLRAGRVLLWPNHSALWPMEALANDIEMVQANPQSAPATVHQPPGMPERAGERETSHRDAPTTWQPRQLPFAEPAEGTLQSSSEGEDDAMDQNFPMYNSIQGCVHLQHCPELGASAFAKSEYTRSPERPVL